MPWSGTRPDGLVCPWCLADLIFKEQHMETVGGQRIVESTYQCDECDHPEGCPYHKLILYFTLKTS